MSTQLRTYSSYLRTFELETTADIFKVDSRQHVWRASVKAHETVPALFYFHPWNDAIIRVGKHPEVVLKLGLPKNINRVFSDHAESYVYHAKLRES